MLNFLLDIPFWKGISLVVLVIAATGLVVIHVTKRLIRNQISKQHEKIGRLLFRVTAGLIALLLSLSYANERVGQSKIIDSLEKEASMIVNSVMILQSLNSDEAKEIMADLQDYIHLTLSDEWETVNTNPFFSEASTQLTDAYFKAVLLPVEKEHERMLKDQLLQNLYQVTELMQVRIYSEATLMPYLIYILCVGLFFMWIFYTVYRIDPISISFITLYNAFIGILIYFVFAMSNPLVGPLKIDAHAFQIIKTKGIDGEYHMEDIIKPLP